MKRLKRADVIEAARAWVDTPFAHQGRTLGERVDCAGLIAMTGRATGRTRYDTTAYGRQPDPERMRCVLDAYLTRIPIAALEPGDVLYLTYGSAKPQHLAIFTGETIIHAYEHIGRCVEHVFSEAWRRRVRAVYRFPEAP